MIIYLFKEIRDMHIVSEYIWCFCVHGNAHCCPFDVSSPLGVEITIRSAKELVESLDWTLSCENGSTSWRCECITPVLDGSTHNPHDLSLYDL